MTGRIETSMASERIAAPTRLVIVRPYSVLWSFLGTAWSILVAMSWSTPRLTRSTSFRNLSDSRCATKLPVLFLLTLS